MTKETFTTRVEELPFKYSVTDVFSGWERTISCFDEIVQLVMSTGTTEQITEMLNIISKYDIEGECYHEQND